MNKHATLDGVVFFFSFEFTKLLTDTVRGPLIIFFFVVSMYHDTADTTFFLKVSENSMSLNSNKLWHFKAKGSVFFSDVSYL